MLDVVSEVSYCRKCSVELTDSNWASSWESINRKECKACSQEVASRSNPSRMYVNGKYIPIEHPLHKPGRYTNFNDAAFSALQKDIKVKEGYVYAISNPAWPDWIKIGMAIDAEDRLNGYQTSSPMRDYELIHFIPSQDRSKAERVAHKAAALCGERQGEWFKITGEEAIVILEHIKESEDEITKA